MRDILNNSGYKWGGEVSSALWVICWLLERGSNGEQSFRCTLTIRGAERGLYNQVSVRGWGQGPADTASVLGEARSAP